MNDESSRGEGKPYARRSGVNSGEHVLPFGRYEGRSVFWVAVVDAPYLWDLIAEEIGSPELRAVAGRALARRMRDDRGADGADAAAGTPPIAPPPAHVHGPAIGHGVRSPDVQATEPTHVARESRDRPPRQTLGAHPRAGTPSMAAHRGRHGGQWLGRLGRNEIAIAAILTMGIGLISWRAYVTRDGRSEPVSVAVGSAATRLPSGSRSDHGASTILGTTDSMGSAPSTTSEGGDHRPAEPTKESVSRASQTARTDGDIPCGARIEGAIPAESAGDFLDTFQAVEFEVVKTKDTGKVTFLNSHEPYRGHFYVAVFPGDYDRFPNHPAAHFRGKCIVVQGMIERYRGAPQIVLRGPEDVRVVE